MANKRVIEYPEILTAVEGDYLLVDNNTEGTRKMKVSAVSRGLIDDVIYTDTTGQTGTQNITLDERLDDYDFIYFMFYFPSESTYVEANPSPLQRIIEMPTGGSYKYFFQTYPSYGNRYIVLTSADGGTSATLIASAWNDLNPSVYQIHGVKFS